MKGLFTADLHIRLGQKNIPKAWARNRYDILWKELNRVYDEYDCDFEIHGGDIFDKLPTMEEASIYLQYIAGDKPIYIYDGNHEATRKGKTFLHLLKDIIGVLNETAEILMGPCSRHGMDFLPYTHLNNFNPKDFSNRILCTHVRGEIKPHVVPEIDLDKLDRWDLVLAGDLHSRTNSQRNIMYPGSPVSITFHRNEVDTGVIVFDPYTLETEWVKLDVPQLYRKTVSSPEDMIKTAYDHTIYEITGNMLELSKVEETDLLDKKIVAHQSQAALELQDKSVLEELDLYLRKIKGFKQPEIDLILKVFNDYTKGIEME